MHNVKNENTNTKYDAASLLVITTTYSFLYPDITNMKYSRYWNNITKSILPFLYFNGRNISFIRNIYIIDLK